MLPIPSEHEPYPEVQIPTLGPVAREGGAVVPGSVLAALNVSGIRNVVRIEEQDDSHFPDVAGPFDSDIEQMV